MGTQYATCPELGYGGAKTLQLPYKNVLVLCNTVNRLSSLSMQNIFLKHFDKLLSKLFHLNRIKKTTAQLNLHFLVPYILFSCPKENIFC